MTASGGSRVTWSAATTGEQLWFVGTFATIRIPGEAVDGRFALIEFLFPRHASPTRERRVAKAVERLREGRSNR
jgi:hypothetical protein